MVTATVSGWKSNYFLSKSSTITKFGGKSWNKTLIPTRSCPAQNGHSQAFWHSCSFSLLFMLFFFISLSCSFSLLPKISWSHFQWQVSLDCRFLSIKRFLLSAGHTKFFQPPSLFYLRQASNVFAGTSCQQKQNFNSQGVSSFTSTRG